MLVCTTSRSSYPSALLPIFLPFLLLFLYLLHLFLLLSTASLGVTQLCTFILLLLSGERDFAVSLNKPIVGARLPTDLPRSSVPFTHFDLLAVVACRVILDGTASNASSAQHLAPVRECLLTALANASPFVKGIGMHAAMSLVKLFERLSDPKVLFSSENVCRLVHLVLEIFNNVVQYQFEGI